MEKKKAKLKSTTFSGPIIRYHSTTRTDKSGSKTAHNFLTFTQKANYWEAYVLGEDRADNDSPPTPPNKSALSTQHHQGKT
eukprot:m.88107 g.88107  ORF g.88107 m.88107 type:complete len:81 (+) comp21442_c0_seq3:610-852(+)